LRERQRLGDLRATLKLYIEALGGALDLVARFGDKTVKLHGV
jgi:hypothetical protein